MRAAARDARGARALNVELERDCGVTIGQPHRRQHRRGRRRRPDAGAATRRPATRSTWPPGWSRRRRPWRCSSGALTHALVRDAVTVEPVEPLELKGKAERVPAFRLIGAWRRASAERRSTPLVGRDRSSDAPRPWLDGRRRRPAPCRLVTVIGEAGVGKSRLVRRVPRRPWPTRRSSSAGAACPTARGSRSGRWRRRCARGRHRRGGPARRGAGEGRRAGGGRRRGGRARRVRHRARPTRLRRGGDVLGRAPAVRDPGGRPAARRRHRRPALGRADAARPGRAPGGDGRSGRACCRVHGPAGGARPRRTWRPGRRTGADRARAACRERRRPPWPQACSADAAVDPATVERIVQHPTATRSSSSRWSAMLDDGARPDDDLEVPPTILASPGRPPRPARGRASGRVLEPASVVGLIFPPGGASSSCPRPSATRVPSAPPRSSGGASSVHTRRHGRPRRLPLPAHPRPRRCLPAAAEARAGAAARAVRGLGRPGERRADAGEYDEILGYHLEQAHRYLSELGPLDDHGRELGSPRRERLAARAGGPSPAGTCRRPRTCCARGDAPAGA